MGLIEEIDEATADYNFYKQDMPEQFNFLENRSMKIK